MPSPELCQTFRQAYEAALAIYQALNDKLYAKTIQDIKEAAQSWN